MDTAKYDSRVYWSVSRFLALEASLLTNHIREIIEQAEAYLEDLRAATAAVQERLRAGILRLRPQAHEDEPMPDPAAVGSDPIFATREFDMPTEIISPDDSRGLVKFDDEDNA